MRCRPATFALPAQTGCLPTTTARTQYFEMRRKSLTNPSRFWAGVAESFTWFKKVRAAPRSGRVALASHAVPATEATHFSHRYPLTRHQWDSVVQSDWAAPAPAYRVTWFNGAQLNITVNALDRHIAAGFGDAPAVTFEADDGSSTTITFAQVLDATCATARVLEAAGVKRGDTVSVYLPMIPQLLFTLLACARMGAVHSTIFAGFSADAVAERITNARSSVVVTADAGFRGGRVVPLKVRADSPLASRRATR